MVHQLSQYEGLKTILKVDCVYKSRDKSDVWYIQALSTDSDFSFYLVGHEQKYLKFSTNRRFSSWIFSYRPQNHNLVEFYTLSIICRWIVLNTWNGIRKKRVYLYISHMVLWWWVYLGFKIYTTINFFRKSGFYTFTIGSCSLVVAIFEFT